MINKPVKRGEKHDGSDAYSIVDAIGNSIGLISTLHVEEVIQQINRCSVSGHTQTCLEYAAKTGKAFCISECADQAANYRTEIEHLNDTISDLNEDLAASARIHLEFRRKVWIFLEVVREHLKAHPDKIQTTVSVVSDKIRKFVDENQQEIVG